MLDSENILNANPVTFAVESKESFSAQAVYQKSKDQFFYYAIKSFFADGFKILILKISHQRFSTKKPKKIHLYPSAVSIACAGKQTLCGFAAELAGTGCKTRFNAQDF